MSNQANAIIPAMRLSELGEFGLINLIRTASARYVNPGRAPWRELLLGIGDDAAAWQSGNHIQLATTDTLVQSVHFDLGVITWEELGWKALAVNLSDIAAMGGIPKYALLSLALPAELKVKDVSDFVEGQCRYSSQYSHHGNNHRLLKRQNHASAVNSFPRRSNSRHRIRWIIGSWPRNAQGKDHPGS